MVIKSLCIVRVMHISCCLTLLFWRWAMESGVKGSLGLVCQAGLLFKDSPVLRRTWVWLPVWLRAAARQPRLCPSVGPSGRRARGGSGAAHMARHTLGSCQHPEPAIMHTMPGVFVCMCVCHRLYTLLWGKVTFQLFHCWVMHANNTGWIEKQ